MSMIGSQEAAKIFFLTFNSLDIAAVIVDRNGEFLLFNDMATYLTGLGKTPAKPEEWTATYGVFLGDKITPFPKESFPLVRALKNEKVHGQIMYVKNVGLPSGHLLSVDGYPIKDLDGEVLGACALFRKVHEKNLISQSYPINEVVHKDKTLMPFSETPRRDQDIVQHQKLESMGMLAGGIAHDFNNILAVIGMHGESVLNEISEKNPVSENIIQILSAQQRAAGLTRQLLAFSRRKVVEKRVISINELILNLEKMLLRLIPEDIHLVQELNLSAGNIEADPTQIEQIIVNLVANSKDAMPQGGQITIQTSVVEVDDEFVQSHFVLNPGSYVVLTVTDTGCGMSSETLSHIFEPFFTTKAHGYGTGLGLATVYGIARQYNGGVWAYSELEQGTAFKVFLPLVHRAVGSHKREFDIRDLRGSERILLVEDEKELREIMANELRKNGYEVLEAENGEIAIDLIQKHNRKIDLVIADVVMPRVGAAELVGRLKNLESEILVLYVSGYTEETLIQRGVSSEEIHFLEKPFLLKTLLRKIRSMFTEIKP